MNNNNKENRIQTVNTDMQNPGMQDLSKPFFQTIYFNHEVDVLFVEDDPFNQQLTRYILKKIGCNAETVGNGKEAIETLNRKTFDVILMDINMPVMNGLEATRIIRENLLSEIPIIAVTGSSHQTDLRNYLNQGMNDMLPKPYTEKQISIIIHKWAKNNIQGQARS